MRYVYYHLLSLAAFALLTGCDLSIRGVGSAGFKGNLLLASPTDGSTSSLAVATITGTGLPVSTLINLYLNDKACSAASIVATATTSASGTLSATTGSLAAGGNGLKTFYFKTSTTSCTKAGFSYTYVAPVPVVSFVNGGTTVTEAGAQLGTALSVQRSYCGLTTTVTITTSDVSAISGTNYTAGTQTITFSPNDCSPKTIAAASFNVVDDGVKTGDLFFKAAITGVTGGTMLPGGQFAQVNILDNAYPGDYTFNQPLYTVAAGSSVTLTIQRSTLGVATIDVAFLDGSATHNIDYISTPQTVHFGATDTELTISVPVTVNAYNSSFFAKLQNPSTGTLVRNLSAAKVRILGAQYTTACNASSAPFGGGSGNLSSPYLICSRAQLAQVTNYSSATFQMMADVTADASIASIASFNGNFDGNEYAIYNFSGAGTVSNFGFFGNAYDGAYIKGINLMFVNVSGTQSNTGGLIGYLGGTSAQQTVSNCLVTGYVTSTSNNNGMLIGSTQGVGTTMSNCLSSGLITTSADASGMIGGLNADQSFTFTNLINTTNVNSTQGGVGGIVGAGIVDYTSTGTQTGLENRGNITAATGYVGGILGSIDNHNIFSISNSVNYGAVYSGSQFAGGVVGAWGASVTTTFTNIINYGSLSSLGDHDGGIFGAISMDSNSTVTLSGLTNNASITGHAEVGGLIGKLDSGMFGGSNSASIDLSSNTGAVHATSQEAGGLVGHADWEDMSGTDTLSISNSTSSGSVVAGLSGYAGGLIGDYTGPASTAALTLNNDTVSGGTISTTGNNVGGLIGQLQAYGTNTFAITGSTVSSNVTTTQSNGGGLIGFVDQTNGATTVNITNSGSSGSLNSNAYSGGLVGYYNNTAGTSVISHSYSTGSNTANAIDSGGLIGIYDLGGTASNAIQKSYSSGSVFSMMTASGGLIGFLQSVGTPSVTITDSTSSGNVTATGNVASILGQAAIASGSNTFTVSRFYSTSVISGGTHGLIGTVTTGVLTPGYTSTYWLKDVGVNAGLTADGKNKTVAQLQTQATYVGWTFNTATGPWLNFVPGSYPLLK